MSLHHTDYCSRRAFLTASLSTALISALPCSLASAEDLHGVIRPARPLPNLTVRCQDGRSASLHSLLTGHVTAIQLMFTTCTTTCPMQGTIFERVQKMLPEMKERRIQLFSLSVDPKNDTPQALTEWLSMFHAGSAWMGAAPQVSDLEAVRSFFGIGKLAQDPHTTQTHILNRSGELVFRTGELPRPEEIAALLLHV